MKGFTMRRGLAVLAFLACTMMVSAASAFVAVRYPLTRLGTYWTTVQSYDSTGGAMVGAEALIYNSGDSSWIGDLVYISAKNQVKHDTILANYSKVAGVVIGGQRTAMQTYADSASVGTLAATAGQKVILAVRGRVWMTMDTTAGIAPGTLVVPSDRQGMRGRFKGKTTIVDTAYRVIGRLPDSGVTNTKRLVNLSIK